MISSLGTTIANILAFIINSLIMFAILLIISWLINKYIFKKDKRNIIKIAIIIWIVVFVINVIAVITNIPIIIGIWNPTCMCGCSGVYYSLGYVIELEGRNLLGDSNYNIEFANIFNYFK